MQVGPYDIIGELGRGGMGVVYRVRRADLDREFALKVVPPTALGSPQAVARLRREAQAAARLATVDGIVGVHDVGEDEGQVYIAMDLVDGQPLDHLIDAGDLTPWQSAEIVTAAARAVHAAHDLGVLHRDLKPANILMDRAGATFVADFGLAKVTAGDAEMTRLTKSGELLGTPAYMPPEQVRGEALDARADVYALGATLFEALGGRPPFQGDSIHGVLRRVLNDEPPSLRALDGRIPRALEAVVFRAMAKAPGERYATAGALADDLERFLQGAETDAKLPSAADRARRWSRRHRTALAVFGVLAVAAGALVPVMLANQRKQAVIDRTSEALTTTELAGRLSGAYLELARETAGAMGVLEDHWQGLPEAAAGAPAALETVRRAVTQARATYPGVRLPEAWLLIAEAYARGEQPVPATLTTVDALEAMGTADPFPRMLAARFSLGRVARNVSIESVHLGGEGVRAPSYREPAELTALRERALALVTTVVDHPVWPELDHGTEYRDFARAGVLFGKREYAAAAGLLETLAEDPLLERGAVPMLGLAWFHADEFGKAAEAWERPVAARWALLMRNAAAARLGAAERVRLNGDDPMPHFRRAAADAGEAVKVWPQERMSRLIRAFANYRMADYLVGRGESGAAPLLEAALRDNNEVLRQSPGEAGALNGLGLIHALRAEIARRGGASGLPELRQAVAVYEEAATADNPSAWSNLSNALRELAAAEPADGGRVIPLLERAVAAATRALEIDPEYAEVLTTRGHARLALAEQRERLGKPNPDDFRAAVDDFRGTLERYPGHIEAQMLRADAFRRLGDSLARTQGDAETAFRTGDEGATAAVEAAPRHPEVRFVRGRLRLAWSKWRTSVGRPRPELLEQALQDLTAAIRQNPGHINARSERGNVRKYLGQAARAAGNDPRPIWREAINDFDAVLTYRPGFDRPHVNRGSVYGDLADYAQSQGEDPAPLEEQAIADYRKALALRPDNFAATYNLGHRWFVRARRRLAAKRDPRAECGKAAQFLQRACELRPGYADAWIKRANVWATVAVTERARKQSTAQTNATALAVLTEAITRLPHDSRFLTNRANLLREMGDDLRAAGQEPRPRYEAALADTDALLDRGNVIWQTHTIRGTILERLNRLEEAIASHETAVQVSGGLPTPTNYLAKARAKLGR